MSAVATIVLRPGEAGTLRAAADRAVTPLVWIRDARAQPTEETLPALLAAGEEPAASLPVDAAGAPLDAAVGRFIESDLEALLRGATAHRVPLRRAPLRSLLVERRKVLEMPPPDPGRYGAYAGAVGAERLFARHGGVLVPASRVRVDALPAGSALHALRAARAGGWGRGETLRELHRSLAG
jgi:hypothetical protein